MRDGVAAPPHAGDPGAEPCPKDVGTETPPRTPKGKVPLAHPHTRGLRNPITTGLKTY